MKPLLYVMPFCIGITHAVPLTAEQMTAGLKTRPELDEIRWKDPARGAPLKVRIVSADSKGLTVDKTLTAGMTTRVVAFSDLAGIEFTLAPRELDLHRSPEPAAVPALKVIWDARVTTMSLNGSNVAETGLALAKSLRLSGEASSLEDASKILDQIRANDTSEDRKDLARAEQTTIDFIRTLGAGDSGTTDKLAWKITEGSGNPDAMLLATSYLCDRHFTELKRIVDENPRWTEDDEVKPERDRGIYNLALDFALYPSLFLGTRGTESAVGLKKAADIYQFTGENLLARKVLEDLAALYPSSGPAKETAALLAKLRSLEAAGKLQAPAPEEEKPAEKTEEKEEAAPTGTPPPPKKYNLFTD